MGLHNHFSILRFVFMFLLPVALLSIFSNFLSLTIQADRTCEKRFEFGSFNNKTCFCLNFRSDVLFETVVIPFNRCNACFLLLIAFLSLL